MIVGWNIYQVEMMCVQISYQDHNTPVDKNFKSLNIDDRMYEVAVINSNLFEPQYFASSGKKQLRRK